MNRVLMLMVCTLLSTGAGIASAQQFAQAPIIQAGTKQVITSADQLPRRSYKLSRLPSELLDAPKSELDAVANALDADLANDLATLDIQDRATRTQMLQARAAIAIHRGELAIAQDYLRQIRAQQEKAADKLTSGVLMENILAARLQGGSPEEQRTKLKAVLAGSLGDMPWATVGDNLKSTKGSLELLSRNLAFGTIKSNLDPLATNLALSVPSSIVVTILAVRNQFDVVQPFRDDIVAVLQALVDRNQIAKPDVWSPRLVTLPASAPGKPVVIGIWDSGTDVAIFQPAKVRGIAFDADMNPTQPLVRPLGDAQARLPALKQYIKGSMDVQAAIDSPDARALKQRIGTLRTEEVKQFHEDLGAIGMWVHGTHVAGIAVDGNPFARLTAVAMHWSSDSVPQKPR